MLLLLQVLVGERLLSLQQAQGEILAMPTPLIHAFNNDGPALYEATRQGLARYIWALYFDGIIFVIAVYFQFVGAVRRAGIITLANLIFQCLF